MVKYHDASEGDVDAAAFVMATEDAKKYNASKDLLTKEEVANLKKPDILVLKYLPVTKRMRRNTMMFLAVKQKCS